MHALQSDIRLVPTTELDLERIKTIYVAQSSKKPDIRRFHGPAFSVQSAEARKDRTAT